MLVKEHHSAPFDMDNNAKRYYNENRNGSTLNLRKLQSVFWAIGGSNFGRWGGTKWSNGMVNTRKLTFRKLTSMRTFFSAAAKTNGDSKKKPKLSPFLINSFNLPCFSQWLRLKSLPKNFSIASFLQHFWQLKSNRRVNFLSYSFQSIRFEQWKCHKPKKKNGETIFLGAQFQLHNFFEHFLIVDVATEC